MMVQNIMQYESKVWSTADSLIGAGIKQSDFPKITKEFLNYVKNNILDILCQV
jgi:hypothetical protein